MIQQVFIFGYYGWKNVGDDAMLYAILQELCYMNSDNKFAILSPNTLVLPQEANDRVSYVKPSLLPVGKEIFNSSAFIIGGGTHLSDFGKKINVLKIQFRIFLLVSYAKILGKKVYILGNGFSPIKTSLGAVLSRLICNIADYISVRDNASYKILINWGFQDKTYLSFDLSALIGPSDTNTNKIEDINVLGISVTPVFEFYYGFKERDVILISEISKYVNDWLKHNQQGEVHLFVFHGQSKDDDILLTRLLQANLAPYHRIKLINYDPDPIRMLAEVNKCDAFIGMKYHSCVFAYITGKPLIVINYHPKCHAFAEEIGLPMHTIISPAEILSGLFGCVFRHMLENPKDFIASLPLEAAKQMAKNGLPHI